MLRAALAALLAYAGAGLIIVGLSLLLQGLLQIRAIDSWTWALVLAGAALLWAAAMLHTLIGLELRGTATLRTSLSRATAAVANAAGTSGTAGVPCADCGAVNLPGVERCAACKRYLR